MNIVVQVCTTEAAETDFRVSKTLEKYGALDICSYKSNATHLQYKNRTRKIKMVPSTRYDIITFLLSWTWKKQTIEYALQHTRETFRVHGRNEIIYNKDILLSFNTALYLRIKLNRSMQ